MGDRGIFDSGCSGHMTGNKDHLDDFEECKGGSVTFGGSKGYITGKGRIRVGNLDFDSVSFVKELGHFNLFLISQICDKHHKVLFNQKSLSDIEKNLVMQEELLQFRLQQVWILVDLPHGAKVIGTKWVYRNKRDERGVVARNKARLVAQGHRQEEGIDYNEVFVPVTRIEAIRLFLAFASFIGLIVVTPRQGGNTRHNVMDIITTQWCRK
ncbi:putative ribonuclease H-like domain-containing protein [Tanacetum coccineum]